MLDVVLACRGTRARADDSGHFELPVDVPDDGAAAVAFLIGDRTIGVAGLNQVAFNASTLQIAQDTDAWIRARHFAATEITAYAPCLPGSTSNKINKLESILSSIFTHVTKYAPDWQTYWLGFMMDEEASYGFSPSSLETINHYLNGLMLGASITSNAFYFTEDFPNGTPADWTLAEYNSILSLSFPAPQVYNSYMVSFVNAACSKYKDCVNDVTINSHLSGTFGSPSAVTKMIHGQPYTASMGFLQGQTPGFYNLFR